MSPDVKLWGGRIYTTWSDNYFDDNHRNIWANVLDWDNPVGISDKKQTKSLSVFSLSQNYPNPFNPKTSIEFSLPHSVYVTLKVFNMLGQEMETLVSKNLDRGNHSYQFNGRKLASGIYYYQLLAGEFSKVKKMILIK